MRHPFLTLVHILINSMSLLMLNKPAGVITSSAAAVGPSATSDGGGGGFQMNL